MIEVVSTRNPEKFSLYLRYVAAVQCEKISSNLSSCRLIQVSKSIFATQSRHMYTCTVRKICRHVIHSPCLNWSASSC